MLRQIGYEREVVRQSASPRSHLAKGIKPLLIHCLTLTFAMAHYHLSEKIPRRRTIGHCGSAAVP
jgi:hypothetical protein